MAKKVFKNGKKNNAKLSINLIDNSNYFQFLNF